MKPLIILSLALYLSGLAGVAAHHLTGSIVLKRLSAIAATAGLLVHAGALAERVFSTGHAPMASMFETLLFYSFCTALVSVVVMFRYDERSTELVTIPVVVLALVFAYLNFKPGGPLTLVLRTRWFETHVTASFAAYAFFTLAFSGAVLNLVYGWMGWDESERRKFQEIAGRSILWGFCLFSASMFSGAIWAYLAWGIYWLWEPKVIWSFIVWFFYAGAMHAYFVRDWRGTGLTVATIIGFFVVLFTYLGVSLLMKSSHSF